MAIPPFNQLFRPILSIISDGQDHSVDEVASILAEEFKLSVEDAAKRTKRGIHTLFENRIAWAKSYLSKADLVRLTGPGTFQISDEGRQILSDGPETLTEDYLKSRYPLFAQWSADAAGKPIDDEIDPDDIGDGTRTLWLLRAGEQGRYVNYFLEHGCVLLGFGDTDDLTGMARDEIVHAIKRSMPSASATTQGQAVNSLIRFAETMKPGDIIVTPEPTTRTVVFGEVVGPYHYHEVTIQGANPF